MRKCEILYTQDGAVAASRATIDIDAIVTRLIFCFSLSNRSFILYLHYYRESPIGLLFVNQHRPPADQRSAVTFMLSSANSCSFSVSTFDDVAKLVLSRREGMRNRFFRYQQRHLQAQWGSFVLGVRDWQRKYTGRLCRSEPVCCDI